MNGDGAALRDVCPATTRAWPKMHPPKIEPYSAPSIQLGAVMRSRSSRSIAIAESVKLYVAENCAAIPITSGVSIHARHERHGRDDDGGLEPAACIS